MFGFADVHRRRTQLGPIGAKRENPWPCTLMARQETYIRFHLYNVTLFPCLGKTSIGCTNKVCKEPTHLSFPIAS